MNINIHGFNGSNQVTMDKGIKTPFHQYIKALIRSNASYCKEGYKLDAENLTLKDQSQFLSYLIHPKLYDYYLKNPILLQLTCTIYLNKMQAYIDDYIEDVFNEDMEEMALCLSRKVNTNEDVFTDNDTI